MPHFQAFAVPGPADPPLDPAVLAQRAVGLQTIPKPKIGAGPDRTKLAVQLWTWLWVDNAPPVSTTVAASGVSVTVTATLATTTWSLGEPATTTWAVAWQSNTGVAGADVLEATSADELEVGEYRIVLVQGPGG